MNYTLDSLRQVERALQEENKSLKIYSKPVIYSGVEMSKLKEQENRLYFGVVSIGSETVAVMSYRGNEILPIDPNSQIIEVFTNLDFQDESGNATNPKGLFRGFEIQLQNQ